MKINTLKGMLFLLGLSLVGCSHTIQGMRQDIHEDTAPPSHTVVYTRPASVVTTTTVPVRSSSSETPTSPAPLETPAQ